MVSSIQQLKTEPAKSGEGLPKTAKHSDTSRLMPTQSKLLIPSGGKGGRAPMISANHQVKPRPISRSQTIYIATQLSVMVETGVPLSEALDSLAKYGDKPHVRAALESVHEKVRNGQDLSAAVASCPYRFPKILPCLLRASEASGTMGLMLSRVADYLNQEHETIKRLRSALIYPTVMLGLALFTVVLMLTFLLPRFAVIYSGHEAVLPWPTRAAFAASNMLQDHWIAILTVLALLVVGTIIYLRSDRGRIGIDWIKINMPIIGRMFQKFYLARSVRTIGTMIASGITIPEAVRLAHGVTGNSYFNALWGRADESLQAGAQLSDPLFASALVPNTVVQMIATGEKTGRLGVVMERIASFCESDLRNTVKTVTAILEPLMIMVMGVIIGGIAMAVLLPVFSISKVLGS